ncbi:reverse transcriptase domain-containing protein [Tanacetum coccineum]
MEILLEPTSNMLMVEHAEFDESNTHVLERFYTSAGNPVKEILLKLNLPDHRKLKDGGEVKEFQRSFRHSDTERLSRSDEVLKLKNFKKDATLKLFKSTNQERYEVPMIGSGSEPIISLAEGMFQKVALSEGNFQEDACTRSSKPNAVAGECMRTRSSGPVVEPSTTPRRRRNKKRSQQQVDPTIVEEKPVVTMADTRTMAELLRAPTEGNAEAIVITSTMKYKDVPDSAIKLMLFPFSIDGPVRIWLEKEPPRSITTWDDLVSKFINNFFPPSKTTNLRNEISNFQQRFDEPFHETWDRFKDLLRACPHHDFTELHQHDTFHNSLNPTDQDSLNSAAGVVAKVSTNTSTSDLSPNVVALTDAVKALLLKNTTPPSAFVKAVEESCVTYGGPHPYYQCPATNGNAFPGYQDNIQAYVSAAAVNYNQGNARHRPPSVAHQVRTPGLTPVHNNQNRGNNYNPGNSTYQAPTPPTQAAPSNELVNYMKVNETCKLCEIKSLI